MYACIVSEATSGLDSKLIQFWDSYLQATVFLFASQLVGSSTLEAASILVNREKNTQLVS